jgi:hypothetical protein
VPNVDQRPFLVHMVAKIAAALQNRSEGKAVVACRSCAFMVSITTTAAVALIAEELACVPRRQQLVEPFGLLHPRLPAVLRLDGREGRQSRLFLGVRV